MKKSTPLAVEDVQQAEKSDGALRLDKYGMPLSPQPSEYSDDPLNWSSAVKLAVTLQVSWLAFLGPMSAAVANPAFVPIGKHFKIGTVQASYSLMMYILWAAFGPLLSVPLANKYGRRPVYLVSNLVAGVCNVAGGYSTSWGGVMATRAIVGIFAGSPPAIGAATICDLYFLHERGFYIGIFTFFLTNGPHTASLIGGFVAQYLGWSYCYTIPGYIQIGTFVITLFALPETLYSRRTTDHKPRTFKDLLLFRAALPRRKLSLIDFARPLYMAKYLTVLLPVLYYMTTFGYGSVLFASTGSQLFARYYHFDTAQTGLILSIPLLIGSFIGEASTGWFTDWLVRRDARKRDGVRRAEARLDGFWLSLLVPVGVVVVGVCMYHHKTVPWIGPAMGMGIANLGLQAATTVTYAYTTDHFKPQSAEISCLINFARSIFSAVISFYAIPLADKVDIANGWVIFACINLAFFVPAVSLRWLGGSLSQKAWQAPPTFHNDI
ncbi:hypothetical protein LTR86_000757 [Recurvomyces mirabilis]|nr:hypothetical protein LTR86_000757 [Recurvomyces mirabilis]